jgi:hypothetical protein
MDDTFPVFFFAPTQRETGLLRQAFIPEGFFYSPGKGRNESIEVAFLHPGLPQFASSLMQIQSGGVGIVSLPDAQTAMRLDLSILQKVENDLTVLSLEIGPAFAKFGVEVPIPHLHCESFKGHILGYLTHESCDTPYRIPGVIRMDWGQGVLIVTFFGIGELISFFHQRTAEIAHRVGRGSAERIAMEGLQDSFLQIPQGDIFIGWLGNTIVKECLNQAVPIPRIGYLPNGWKNIVTFSFDDLNSTAKPVKLAFQNFWKALLDYIRQKSGLEVVWKFLNVLLRQAISYPLSYQEDLRRLVNLFDSFNAVATGFLLPFWGFIKNRPNMTGYRGFSKQTFRYLQERGWDIGTHLKPRSLQGYDACMKKFVQRFSSIPKGHRGHELGWVGWHEDFERLNSLGYQYDTTWNRGGEEGLRWMTGTGFPFRPVDGNGSAYEILELPTAAWVEDLQKTLPENWNHITNALELFPGIYNIGAHTWKIKEKRYAVTIHGILEIGSLFPETGMTLHLADITEFWMDREKSLLNDLQWNATEGWIKFKVQNTCGRFNLPIRIPYRWENGECTRIIVNDEISSFSVQSLWGTDCAVLEVKPGHSQILVLFRVSLLMKKVESTDK